VEEVGRSLAALGLDKLILVFAANKVTGDLLANCDEAGDLMTEDFGVTSRPVAKVLMPRIKLWVVEGVTQCCVTMALRSTCDVCLSLALAQARRLSCSA
jgi:hypothetical protein